MDTTSSTPTVHDPLRAQLRAAAAAGDTASWTWAAKQLVRREGVAALLDATDDERRA